MGKYEKIVNYKSEAELINGVLKNKFGLMSQEELDRAERVLTNYKLAKLYLEENEIKFTVDYYLRIHKTLFEDIYPFAGTIRSDVIEKTIPFCLPNLIYENLVKILRKAEILSNRITNEGELVDAIAYIYSELDIIHPFREGNGRVEREFLRQYVEHINKNITFGEYVLDYSQISSDEKDDLIRAIIIADATCDLEPLKNYIKMILVNKNLGLNDDVKTK